MSPAVGRSDPESRCCAVSIDHSRARHRGRCDHLRFHCARHLGRSRAPRRRTGLKEPLGVVQASLVGFVALLLAFGLTMAIGRYETRRVAVVLEANAIGTTYLRAQTLAEPMRTSSLELLKRYAEPASPCHSRFPTRAVRGGFEQLGRIQNQLWTLAGDALRTRPRQRTPPVRRDAQRDDRRAHHTSRRARQSHPCASALAAALASALALGVLGMFLASHDRGVSMALLAAGLVTVILLVIFDLDRPHRGTDHHSRCAAHRSARIDGQTTCRDRPLKPSKPNAKARPAEAFSSCSTSGSYGGLTGDQSAAEVTMKILVVEDEKRLAATVKRGLEQEGFAVDVALDGTDGLWMATEQRYDAIVLDIMLPGMNGYQVCAAPRRGRLDADPHAHRQGRRARRGRGARHRRRRLPVQAVLVRGAARPAAGAAAPRRGARAPVGARGRRPAARPGRAPVPAGRRRDRR